MMAAAYHDAADIVERANTGLHQSAMLSHLVREIRAQAEEPARFCEAPPITVRDIRTMMHLRAMRERHLPSDLFRDCAWDMLLMLYVSEQERRRVSVSALCTAGAAPTTGLRWITTMTADGLLVREPDQQDGRRVWLRLSDGTRDAMTNYFDAVRARSGALRMVV